MVVFSGSLGVQGERFKWHRGCPRPSQPSDRRSCHAPLVNSGFKCDLAKPGACFRGRAADGLGRGKRSEGLSVARPF